MFASVYCRESVPSQLNFVNFSEDMKVLIDSVGQFGKGTVKIYDLNNLQCAAVLFPTGRVSIKEEYREAGV